MRRLIVLKAKPLHVFFQFASNFSLESMIIGISSLAFSLTSNPDKDFNMFASVMPYKVVYGGRVYDDSVHVYQTNLIDVLHDIINGGYFGKKYITQDEMLFLIHLHVNLEGERHTREKSDIQFWLRFFGSMGEQRKFQEKQSFLDEFARERYILEVVSKKTHIKNSNVINFYDEFIRETSLSPKVYSAILYILFIYFFQLAPIINPKTLESELKNPELSTERMGKMLQKYSISIEALKKGKIDRQRFYMKPFIKIGETYVSSNPILTLMTFVNSNYWVIRNVFNKRKSQDFLNEFGKHFEMYFEEILENCFLKEQYENIEESDKEKRADWHICIGEYHFLVEQKSAVSNIKIKQTHSDVESIKTHITRNWGKAVKQLSETEKALGLTKAIKIILVYEDYYNCECLSKLFEIEKSLTNDNYYWLVSIKDFEILAHTYKTDQNLFFKIISEKIHAEETQSNEGRDLTKFFAENGIKHNEYLDEFGISKYFKDIEKFVLE